ncbi:MAG: hypothetical protein K2M31_06000 [Muribaculaceae bacterium]|nr:hypothetical protein [Muribaculaceae bacterium]
MRKYKDYEDLLEKYPYFAYAALKAIPLAPDDEVRNRLRRLVAVNIGDPADIAEILGLNSDSLADFYPDGRPPKLGTFDTIDTFLSTFGDQTQKSAVKPAGNEAIPTGSPLDSVPKPAPIRRPVPEPQPTEESPALTESFARILIKNRNYEKALEIIQQLNLNNPEKSIYFADQIRFLKKLILNESRKKS